MTHATHPPLAHGPARRWRTRQVVVAFLLGMLAGGLVLVVIPLVALAGTVSAGQGNAARGVATAANLKVIAAMLGTYQLDTGGAPGNLGVLVPKYLAAVSSDGWGRPWIYAPGPTANGEPYSLRSAGPDGAIGTSDDVDVWLLPP